MEQFLRGFFDKLKEQNVLDEIIPNANMMIKYLLKYEKIHPKNPQIKTIKDSLRKIKNNPNPFNTNEQFVLYKKNIINTFKAIEIYSRSMVQATTEKEKRIEQQLFDISFVLGENYETKILPVYLLHDDFLNATESICSLKSSTGSGKTRCAPFFFAIKTIKTNMEQPFFIMTQPSTTIINDKIEDFQNIIGNSVTLISNDIYKFKQFFSSYTLNPRTITKPIVALFTPHKLARLFAEIETIYECSRFVLDEIHERSVETDVVTAILAQKLRTSTIPLHLLMMTATPDIRITNLFKGYHYKNFELENSLLFPIEDIKIEVPNFNKIDETAQYETMEIIKKMDSKQIKIGHILIFTSGNRRINNIIDLISREIKKNAKINTIIKN